MTKIEFKEDEFLMTKNNYKYCNDRKIYGIIPKLKDETMLTLDIKLIHIIRNVTNNTEKFISVHSVNEGYLTKINLYKNSNSCDIEFYKGHNNSSYVAFQDITKLQFFKFEENGNIVIIACKEEK